MRKINYFLLSLFILLPLFFLVVNQSHAILGRWETKVGNPADKDDGGGDDGGGGATFPKCKTLQTNPTSCLLKDFKIIAGASYGHVPTKSTKIKLYNLVWKNAQSKEWRRQLKKTGPFTILLGNCSVGSCTNGPVPGQSKVLRIDRFTTLPDAGKSYIVTHEVGHMMRTSNLHITKRFNPSNHSGTDKGCYDRGYIISYFNSGSCSVGLNITAQSESYSEAMANYITKNSYNRTGFGGCARSINNFKTKCSSTYKWMRNNTFGKHEYN